MGDTATANPRWEVAYQLCAQPGALLDFTHALQAAGHIIPARFREPVTMTQLMQQLEGLMTPPSGHGSYTGGGGGGPRNQGRGSQLLEEYGQHGRSTAGMTSGRRGGAGSGNVRGYMSVEMVKRGTKRGALTMEETPMLTITPMLTTTPAQKSPAHATHRPMTRQRSALAMSGQGGCRGGMRGGGGGLPEGVRPLEVARVTITLEDIVSGRNGGGGRGEKHALGQVLTIAVSTVTGSEVCVWGGTCLASTAHMYIHCVVVFPIYTPPMYTPYMYTHTTYTPNTYTPHIHPTHTHSCGSSCTQIPTVDVCLRSLHPTWVMIWVLSSLCTMGSGCWGAVHLQSWGCVMGIVLSCCRCIHDDGDDGGGVGNDGGGDDGGGARTIMALLEMHNYEECTLCVMGACVFVFVCIVINQYSTPNKTLAMVVVMSQQCCST